jgi:hypothetical protein
MKQLSAEALLALITCASLYVIILFLFNLERMLP